MNAALMMESCPDPETLSAFIDQRLDPASRLEVVKHLADCAECREIVVMANEYSVENEAEGGKVARGRFGTKWMVPLAAAAMLAAMLFGVPSIREQILGRDDMAKLVAAADSLPERMTNARLSGDFAYKGHTTYRNAEKKDPEIAVLIAAADVAERAEKNPSPANLHASGVASFLIKEPAESVRLLESAA